MKIRPTTIITNSNNNLFTRVKNYFFTGKFMLKTLLKDVFEKSNKHGAKTNMSEKFPYPRKLPNSFSAPDEVFSKGEGGKIRFYPEDLKKMKKMSIDEILEYKEKLIKEGKYFE